MASCAIHVLYLASTREKGLIKTDTKVNVILPEGQNHLQAVLVDSIA